MKKYLVLYRSPVSAADQMKGVTPEQMKAGMDAWMKWAQSAGSAIVDLGSPLGPSAVLKGEKGPGFIGGYSILQAESLDHAKKILEGHPHLHPPGFSIEVLETMPMPGM